MIDLRTSTNNFPYEELQCKCGCNQVALAQGFPQMLQNLRDKFGRPMTLNSACRCTRHNGNIGGHPRSLHLIRNPKRKAASGEPLGTCGVDVNLDGKDATYVGDLIRLAHILGWSVGHGYTYHSDTKTFTGFVHLDRRDLSGLYRADFWY